MQRAWKLNRIYSAQVSLLYGGESYRSAALRTLLAFTYVELEQDSAHMHRVRRFLLEHTSFSTWQEEPRMIHLMSSSSEEVQQEPGVLWMQQQGAL